MEQVVAMSTIELDTLRTTLTMLALISVVGSLGNCLVIVVYARKHDQLTATLFILTLAVTDCFTCTIIVPMTIYVEYRSWQLSSDWLCKLYYFLDNAIIPFSAYLISLIAIDRYLCICRPFSNFLTISRSKLTIAGLLFISSILGIMSALQIGIQTNEASSLETNSNSSVLLFYNVTKCAETIESNKTSDTHFIFYIVQKSQIVNYTLCIVIVICLYVVIYCTVLRVRQKKAKLKGGTNNKKRPTYSWESRSVLLAPRRLSDVGELTEPRLSSNIDPATKCFLTVPGADSAASPSPDNRRLSIKSICETPAFQNLRTASILFVVALSYIVSFMPAFLIITHVVSYHPPLLYMYYINNAVNPIIYGFFNKKFRDDIRAIISKLRNRLHLHTSSSSGAAYFQE